MHVILILTDVYPSEEGFSLYNSGEMGYLNAGRGRRVKGSYLEFVKARTNPGVIIFDANNHLVYSNKEAFVFVPGLRKKKSPAEFAEMCRRARSKTYRQVHHLNNSYSLVVDDAMAAPFAIRALPIKERGAGRKSGYVMILLEKIAGRHFVDLDFEELREGYRLTKRETGVLRLICEGLTNQEIAARLFICEFTVKDHIKKIMDKMNLRSRSEIIASMLKSRFPESGKIRS